MINLELSNLFPLFVLKKTYINFERRVDENEIYFVPVHVYF